MPGVRRADPDLDHVLVDIDPGHPLTQHSHTPARLLQQLTPKRQGKASRPPEPKISTGD
jgi:hypothetical protein